MKKVILLSASMLLLSTAAFAVGNGRQTGSLNDSSLAEHNCHVNHISGCVYVKCDGQGVISCGLESGLSISFNPSTTPDCTADAKGYYTVQLQGTTSLSCGQTSAPEPAVPAAH